MESVTRDVRQAVRSLRRSHRFAGPVVATLALGAGVGLALLTLVEGGLFLPDGALLGPDAPPWPGGWTPATRSPHEIQAESLEVLLRVAGGAALLVLAIAAINVGLLVAARSAARQPEVVLRAALGAGRLRLGRQLLTEAAVLALLGGTLGFMVYGAALAVLHATWPESLPRWLDMAPSAGASLLALAVPLSTATAAALLPLRAASIAGLAAGLGAGSRSTPGPHEGIARRWAVILAVASSVALLVGAGLLLRAFAPAAPGDGALSLGYDPRDTLTIRVDLGMYAFSAQLPALLLDRAGQVPGVRAAALATEGAWLGLGTEDRVEVVCGNCVRGNMLLPVTRGMARHHAVSPGHFAALGIPLLRGREFTADDVQAGERVAVVSRAFARLLFLGTDPLGKEVRPPGGEGWYTVVGVVEDVRARGLGTGAEAVPAIYLAASQHPAATLVLAVRGSGDPAALAASVRRALHGSAPGLRLSEEVMLAERIRAHADPMWWLAGVLAALAASGALIASLGLFGVVSYTVGRRIREMGVRIALGARPAQVVRMVVWQSIRMAAVGVAFGVGAVLGVARLLQLLLAGVRPLDPLVYGAVVVLLVLVALLASILPARTAARVDPLIAMRAE